MAIITKTRLANVTETKLGGYTFRESLREAKAQNKFLAQVTIFLSHSHADLEDGIVDKVIVFLRKLGILVYIDSNDASLPPTTSADTASKLKERIRSCNKFILLATNNSIASKWCNWELGFGDAHKYIDRIALFPIAESNNNWNGSEYLKIYPRIEEGYVKEYYKVIYPNGNEKNIADWLKL